MQPRSTANRRHPGTTHAPTRDKTSPLTRKGPFGDDSSRTKIDSCGGGSGTRRPRKLVPGSPGRDQHPSPPLRTGLGWIPSRAISLGQKNVTACDDGDMTRRRCARTNTHLHGRHAIDPTQQRRQTVERNTREGKERITTPATTNKDHGQVPPPHLLRHGPRPAHAGGGQGAGRPRARGGVADEPGAGGPREGLRGAVRGDQGDRPRRQGAAGRGPQDARGDRGRLLRRAARGAGGGPARRAGGRVQAGRAGE